MDVGMMMVFASYGWDDCPDDRVWEEEIRLARLAADSGFDVLWSAEHHFNDYSFVPDNLHLMSYLAGVCPGMSLGTAAVILPWHDPLRVAENAAVLDMLCGGKLRLGMGRGLARREFAAFRLSMDESRERFDEAAPLMVRLETMAQGLMERVSGLSLEALLCQAEGVDSQDRTAEPGPIDSTPPTATRSAH